MKTTINRLNSFCIILCSLSMSTISSAEAQKTFDPGLPPPVVASDYYASAQKLVEQINIAPIDETDTEQFYLKLIGNSNNYYNAVSQAYKSAPDMRIVIHGDGINMLVAAKSGSYPKLTAKLDELMLKEGVKFLVCYNTLTSKKIRIDQLYKINSDNIIPAGVAEIARLQGLGYAYLKL